MFVCRWKIFGVAVGSVWDVAAGLLCAGAVEFGFISFYVVV